jgi:transcriptional regulator with XRE-family HTH domain
MAPSLKDSDTTAERIKRRREELCLSQAELAALLKRPREMVSQWETGHRHPSTEESIVDLCKALRCSADYLFGISRRP